MFLFSLSLSLSLYLSPPPPSLSLSLSLPLSLSLLTMHHHKVWTSNVTRDPSIYVTKSSKFVSTNYLLSMHLSNMYFFRGHWFSRHNHGYVTVCFLAVSALLLPIVYSIVMIHTFILATVICTCHKSMVLYNNYT